MKIPAITSECTGCGICILTCPQGALGPGNPKRLDASKCRGCGKCVRACPNGARTLVEAEPE